MYRIRQQMNEPNHPSDLGQIGFEVWIIQCELNGSPFEGNLMEWNMEDYYDALFYAGLLYRIIEADDAIIAELATEMRRLRDIDPILARR
jgi:hypothetical protein